jgi:hypothetical protein
MVMTTPKEPPTMSVRARCKASFPTGDQRGVAMVTANLLIAAQGASS